MTKRRLILSAGVGLGGTLLVFVLLILMFVSQATPRTWLLQEISRHLGWLVAVEEIGFSYSPAQIRLYNFTLAKPDGLLFTLQQGVVGLDATALLAGRLSFIELHQPTLHLPEVVDTPVPLAAQSSDKPTVQLSWLPLPPISIDRLQVTAGSLDLPATIKRPAWRFWEIYIVGENISQHKVALTFSSQTMPGGTLQGDFIWDGSLRILAKAQQAAAVPLLGLLGVVAQEGVLQADVDVHITTDGRMTAAISARLDRLRLANGWEGSWSGTLHAQGNTVRVQLDGLASPASSATFAPTMLTAEFSHVKEVWKLLSMTVEIRPFGSFTGSGVIFPHMQQQIVFMLTVAQPFALATWGGVSIAAGQWSISQPWRANLALNGTTTAPHWTVELQTGPDQVLFQDIVVRNLTSKIQISPQEQAALPSLLLLKQKVLVEVGADQLKQGKNSAQNLHLGSTGFISFTDGKWSLANTKVDLTWEKKPLHWQGNGHGTVAGKYAFDGWLTAGGGRIHTLIGQEKNAPLRVNLLMDARQPLLVQAWQTWLPPGLSLAGEVLGKVELQSLSPGWSGRIDLHVQKGQVQHSQDSLSRVGEGQQTQSVSEAIFLGESLRGDLQGQFLWVDGKPGRFNGQLRLREGEWLAGSFYGDMRSEALLADFALLGGDLWSVTIKLQSRTVADMHVWVSPIAKGFSGRLLVKKMDLGRLFHTYLLEVVAAERPAWKTAVFAGWLGADLHVAWSGQGKPQLNGWLELQQGKIHGPQKKWAVGEISLFLPFAQKGRQARQQKPGILRLQHIHFQDSTLPLQEVQPVWQDDTLQLLGSLQGEVLGGRFGLAAIKITDIWSADRTVSLALNLQDGDMDLLSRQLGLSPIAGHLQIDLSEIHWQNGLLQTEGSISAQVFAGELRLNNLSAEQLFSGLPVWHSDFQVTKVDLESLSTWLGVGLIQGTLSGEVQNLTMLGSEPLSFSAKLASEEGEKSQRISVKAIENIQTLGSGAASGVLQSGLLAFFDSFGYKHIGFQCRLKNDTFHLRGVESEDGKEYLVVGSFLPPRVDVVSHNPMIGWKDMVARLKRIASANEPENDF